MIWVLTCGSPDDVEKVLPFGSPIDESLAIQLGGNFIGSVAIHNLVFRLAEYSFS